MTALKTSGLLFSTIANVVVTVNLKQIVMQDLKLAMMNKENSRRDILKLLLSELNTKEKLSHSLKSTTAKEEMLLSTAADDDSNLNVEFYKVVEKMNEKCNLSIQEYEKLLNHGTLVKLGTASELNQQEQQQQHHLNELLGNEKYQKSILSKYLPKLMSEEDHIAFVNNLLQSSNAAAGPLSYVNLVKLACEQAKSNPTISKEILCRVCKNLFK